MGTGTKEGWDWYATASARRYGGYDLRRAPRRVRRWQRLAYQIGRMLTRLRVRPGTVALLGLGLSLAVPVVAGRGPRALLLAAGLVALSTLAAAVAGALAVLAAGRPRRGMVWETVASRLGEVSWLAAFWVAGAPGPLVVACGVLVGLYEYVRAQALVAGMSRIGVQTASDRPVRVPMVVLTLVVAGLAGLVSEGFTAGVLTLMTGLWVVLALLGLGQLAGIVRRSLR